MHEINTRHIAFSTALRKKPWPGYEASVKLWVQLVTGNSASKVFRAASSQLAVPFRTVSGLHLGRGRADLGTPESESAPRQNLFSVRFEFSN